MTDDLRQLWKDAARLDKTLRATDSDLRALAKKRIHPEPYSRARHFTQTAAGRPFVATDFVVPLRGANGGDIRATLSALYRRGFPKKQKARVQTGAARTRRQITVGELMDRWERGRAVISVTDLHLRDTRVGDVMDISVLSDFNLLLAGTKDMSVQEIMTLVVSSKGNVTDSHSDDPDGSNHSFCGRKLWLGWETFEGQAAGLEDNSRGAKSDPAAFNLKAFLSLPSSCWFTVSSGETLFLPGRLTHKVLTLEPYLGVGSFYVALPCAVDTITRWTLHRALWELPTRENDHLVGEITRAITKKVRALRSGSRKDRDRWGYDYLRPDLDAFDSRDEETRHRLLLDGDFARMIDEVRAAVLMG